MKIIGITGLIGTGKTTLSKLFQTQGCKSFNADQFTRRLYRQKSFLHQIAVLFPESIQNNTFNKSILRKIVFSNPNQLLKLENLIHPLIKKEIKRQVRRSYKTTHFLIIDIALLARLKIQPLLDLLILTQADPQISKSRVLKRDHISAPQYDQILNIQNTQNNNPLQIDIIIDTNQPLNLLKSDIIEILNGLSHG